MNLARLCEALARPTMADRTIYGHSNVGAHAFSIAEPTLDTRVSFFKLINELSNRVAVQLRRLSAAGQITVHSRNPDFV